jgi:glycosyltransferase involved in cell wall biosynthesis
MGSIVHAILSPDAASGYTMDVLNPLSDSVGGGCRAAFLNLVKELPKYGHQVRAFSLFRTPASINNVQYFPLDQLDKHGHPNVMWAQYDARPLRGRWGCLRIASHHSYLIEGLAAFEHTDVNTAPSQAALETLKAFWAPWADWRVLPNAVEAVPDWNPVSGRVVYHTSAGRGLHLLAQMWPEIKARVPHATLHVISDLDKLYAHVDRRGIENSEISRRVRALKQNLELAQKAGGVTLMANLPRTEVLKELSAASVFAFPCSVVSPCETFSVSIMECCKIGIPVVLTPQDALESIYKDHVYMVPGPAEKSLAPFTDAVVKVLQDSDVSKHYSALGRELAKQYTYEKAGKVLSDIICQNTGFVPIVTTTPPPEPPPQPSNDVPGYQPSDAPDPKPAPTSSSRKKIAFLLDPWAAVRPINPEVLFTDPRGLTGSEITNLMQAIEMGRQGHDVTMYSNFSQNFSAHGIQFARWDRWQQEAKQDWYAAFATIHPGGFQHMNKGPLRIFNQQVNDFGYCHGWEQYTDIVTALSHAHQKHLSQFSQFKDWRILPNGCDPSVYYEFPRNNHKLVYASSPDRGLHWLLELFPRLKKRVPDVECHVYYHIQDNAVQIYEQLGEKELANRYKYINMAVSQLQGRGLFHHKSVSRCQMVKVLSESRILAYTCDPVRFTEGFSCTTLEGAVSGCLPVICGSDALGEIYGNFVPTTPAPYAKNKDHYFDNLLRFLTDNEVYKVAQARGREMGKTHNWAEISKQVRLLMGLT